MARGPGDPVGRVGALDEPTRRRLYDYVAGSREPVGRDEAAQAVGIARVTAAFHLDRLAEAGLLEVSHRRLTGRSGPGAGRPAKLYRRAERDVEVSLPPRHYDLAGELLAGAVEEAESSGTTVRQALARRARDVGRVLAGRPGAAQDPVRLLIELGFEPYEDDGFVRLANCPFHRLARSHTELVCGMNLQLITGILDAAPAAPYTAELEPGEDRCCVALRPATEPDGGSGPGSGATPSG
jgi:predicted ArsR family transcriptional regulator